MRPIAELEEIPHISQGNIRLSFSHLLMLLATGVFPFSAWGQGTMPVLGVQRSGSAVVVMFTGEVLQSATNVTGPWLNETNASPFTNRLDHSAQFYRSVSNYTCRGTIFDYHGPTNTAQLQTLLNESTNATLQSLDSATKTSLVTYMVFFDGRPAGFSAADTNIQHLYDIHATNVFAAIYATNVLLVTFDTKPLVRDISQHAFDVLVQGGASVSGLYSFCSNCLLVDPKKCCGSNGPGCNDAIVVVNDNDYYHVR